MTAKKAANASPLHTADATPALLTKTFSRPMTENKGREYCLIVEGAYLTEGEAEHALRDPFIEDWVEQTGHFKIHNMDDIQVTPGCDAGFTGRGDAGRAPL